MSHNGERFTSREMAMAAFRGAGLDVTGMVEINGEWQPVVREVVSDKQYDAVMSSREGRASQMLWCGA
jgi:hypothetical protein